MDTSKLEGAELDAAVFALELAEALDLSEAAILDRVAARLSHGTVPRYGTQWGRGGPIIERERIQLMPWREEMRHIASWTAKTLDGYEGEGHTVLIAAMRAFVASKAPAPRAEQWTPAELAIMCEKGRAAMEFNRIELKP
jgi:DNA-binding Lrp family transcriptional regulator